MYGCALKETLKSRKADVIDSDPANIITIGLKARSKIFQGRLKALDHGNKMFQTYCRN